MQFSSFHPTARVLMGPGPSDLYPRVLEALSRPTIGHLDPQFIRMMDEVKALLQSAFLTKNEMTMVVSGPGSAGMETAVVNLVEPGEKVIVCQNGVFGGRIAEMARRCGGEVITVEQEWGRAVNPEKLKESLQENPDASIVAFVHAETSTGALSDAKTLAEMARKHGCLTLVDAVTSLGGVELQVDDWELDAVYSGSQKCLSCTPGLSPVTFSRRAMEKVRNRRQKVQSWFLDLTEVEAYWGGNKKRSYHHTAPINALYGMHEALLILQEEGLENSWQRHHKNYLELKSKLSELGLEFFVPENERLPNLNAVSIPSGADDGKIRKQLLDDYNLEIGSGLGPMAGKIWRIGLMGYSSSLKNVLYCSAALKEVLGR
ncbi:MAG: alanine--glyoxylate aminotransferase family protein [Calditrichia bacterium]